VSVIACFVLQSIVNGKRFFIIARGIRLKGRGGLIGGGLLNTDEILRSGVLVEIQIQCPHCGEIITSTADTSQGDYSTIEDCEVCCAPMNIEVICEPGRVEEVRVSLA
jgi:hypothetical protein